MLLFIVNIMSMNDLIGNVEWLRRLSQTELVTLRNIYTFVEQFFHDPKFDASHDFAHVRRVTDTAVVIWQREEAKHPLDLFMVVLGALLHDVEDKKYSTTGESGRSRIESAVLAQNLSGNDAATIKKLVDGVSYSSEVEHPDQVLEIIEDIPELAVVQDADRLDAIGAIGIARCFTFGGAKGVRSIDDSVQHFRDKLLKLEGMMKTETGRRMAKERSQRIRDFMSWWEDETGGRA
jgi:uncharacterized protein